ncbi:MAG: hypothetical protein JSS49_01470 [Planctomycetes bacterium]|nr:hypothetical protein [Planctomycetota bacterium]
MPTFIPPETEHSRPLLELEGIARHQIPKDWIEEGLWQEYVDRMLTYYEALYDQTGIVPDVTLENLQRMFNGEPPEPDMSLVTMPEPQEVLSAAETLARRIRPQGSDLRPAVDGFREVGRPAPIEGPAPNMPQVSSGADVTPENMEFVATPEASPQQSPELVGCGG